MSEDNPNKGILYTTCKTDKTIATKCKLHEVKVLENIEIRFLYRPHAVCELPLNSPPVLLTELHPSESA